MGTHDFQDPVYTGPSEKERWERVKALSDDDLRELMRAYVSGQAWKSHQLRELQEWMQTDSGLGPYLETECLRRFVESDGGPLLRAGSDIQDNEEFHEIQVEATITGFDSWTREDEDQFGNDVTLFIPFLEMEITSWPEEPTPKVKDYYSDDAVATVMRYFKAENLSDLKGKAVRLTGFVHGDYFRPYKLAVGDEMLVNNPGDRSTQIYYAKKAAKKHHSASSRPANDERKG